MDTSIAPSYANVFDSVLSFDEVRQRAPAVFASCAHERMSSKYAFIPTERVLAGLTQAGFVPVEARQTRTRCASRLHARHVIRLRRRCETIQVKDAVPELLFLNSHDGTSAYQLRVGLYRAVCTNGLIVSVGAFPTIRVSHRTDIIDELIAGALDLAKRFETLAEQVDRMQRRLMFKDEQIRFAEHALALRFPDLARSG